MVKYLDKVSALTLALKYFSISHITWCKNARADTLPQLATLADNSLGQTYIEHQEAPNIDEAKEVQ